MYGLNDAPRSWPIAADKRMRNTGLRVHPFDPLLVPVRRFRRTPRRHGLNLWHDFLGIGNFTRKKRVDFFLRGRNDAVRHVKEEPTDDSEDSTSSVQVAQ